MMKYLVENKVNTFLVSWKNPQIESKDFGFEEYVEKGVIKAIEIAEYIKMILLFESPKALSVPRFFLFFEI